MCGRCGAAPVLVSLLWSLVPGLIWLTLLNRIRDRAGSPFRVALAFVLGALAVTPAGLVPGMLGIDLGRVQSHRSALAAALGVAAIEESLKLALVLLIGHRQLCHRLDGIVFACSTGLGFATLETALYVGRYGEQVLVIRAFTAVCAHAAFTGIAGYWLGLARERGRDARWLIAKGLAFAILLHGAYDALLARTAVISPALEIAEGCLVLATLAIALSWLIAKLRRAIDDARIKRLLQP